MWKKRLLSFALSAVFTAGMFSFAPAAYAAPASGQTYYVSPAGSDANDGSAGAP